MSDRESDCTVRAMRRPDGRVTVMARRHALDVDGQTSLDDSARSPSSLDTLIAALAADVLAGFEREATRAGVPVDDAELSLSAWLDNPLAALGVAGETGSPAVASIAGTLYVSAEARDEELRALWGRALERAPVYSTLHRCAEVRIEFRNVS
jgi:hypothetical protein